MKSIHDLPASGTSNAVAGYVGAMHHDRDPVRHERRLVLRVLVAHEHVNAVAVGDLEILRRDLQRLCVGHCDQKRDDEEREHE
jgi:hypothetical protein